MSILPQIITNSLIAGGLYALLGMGFNLAYGTSKFFNFVHGSCGAIAGYTVFYFAERLSWPFYIAAILGLLSAGLTAFVFDKLIYLPLQKKKSSDKIKLVASIGLFTAIQAILAIVFTSQFQSFSRSVGEQKIYILFGGIFTHIQLIIFLSAIAILATLLLLLKFTKFGKSVKAMSDDSEVAKIVGIDTNKVSSYVFFISGALAGWAGILVGADTGIEPTMGLSLFLKAAIVGVIGGLGSVRGAFLGAMLLGFAENFGIWKISGQWKDAIAFGLLIIFLIFKPKGIIED